MRLVDDQALGRVARVLGDDVAAVATVAIGNGANAGLLAAQILATANPALALQVAAYRQQLHDQVVAKDARLVELGAAAYLAQMG